ncbi:MAG: cell division protein FtsA [Candidatus Omnitrophica bacterium]|nr:cell division protein FtsA [Candidatus Omnitrophota bacterium]
MREEIVVALDLGSNKIFGIVGMGRENKVEVIGSHVVYPETEIIQNGKVIDLEGTTQYVSDIMRELETQTDKPLQFVNIGIGGGFIKGSLTSREATISNNQIEQEDIQNIIKAATGEISAEPDQKILNLFPQEYVIDKETNVKKNPEGMFGNSLEAKIHVLVALSNPLQNFIQCIKKSGSMVDKIFPHSWACAELLLSDEEKQLGSLLIDFGKGTTNFLLYVSGNLVGTYSLVLGGGLIDSDISQILNTTPAIAEELKKNYGWCNFDILKEEKSDALEKQVEIPYSSGRLKNEVSIGKISEIVYDRVDDIFSVIKALLEKEHKFSTRKIGSVIITGGSSLLKGLIKMNEQIFVKPVRLGISKKITGLPKQHQTPAFSSGIGTLLLSLKEPGEKKLKHSAPFLKKITNIKNKFSDIWDKW